MTGIWLTVLLFGGCGGSAAPTSTETPPASPAPSAPPPGVTCSESGKNYTGDDCAKVCCAPGGPGIAMGDVTFLWAYRGSCKSGSHLGFQEYDAKLCKDAPPAPWDAGTSPSAPAAPASGVCGGIARDALLDAAVSVVKSEPDRAHDGWCTLTYEAKKAIKFLSYDYTCHDADGVKIDEGNEVLEDLAVGDKVKSEFLCEHGTKTIKTKTDRSR